MYLCVCVPWYILRSYPPGSQGSGRPAVKRGGQKSCFPPRRERYYSALHCTCTRCTATKTAKGNALETQVRAILLTIYKILPQSCHAEKASVKLSWPPIKGCGKSKIPPPPATLPQPPLLEVVEYEYTTHPLPNPESLPPHHRFEYGIPNLVFGCTIRNLVFGCRIRNLVIE